MVPEMISSEGTTPCEYYRFLLSKNGTLLFCGQCEQRPLARESLIQTCVTTYIV